MSTSIASVLGTTGLGLLSGCVLSSSLFSVPVILTAPSEIQPVLFKRLFAIGKSSMPTLAAVTAGTLVFSYATSPVTKRDYLYSAGLALAIVPFTLIFMMPTVTACLEPRPDSAVYLKRWAYLNFIRGMFPLIGFVLNLIATAGRN
ncbi:hypothetical protein V1525DRAFT_393647 [Lipomyces kononenkoae]|uniref:Uncharacterized protein n=1 Tax=Lipomyces kononenkoae TaxID=34357 RepID=A0ACC3TAV8_LIPKO